MEKKYCVVCGSENFSRSKLYCSLKCKNQDYYRKNKEELLEKHNEWNKENYDKVRKQSKQWKENTQGEIQMISRQINKIFEENNNKIKWYYNNTKLCHNRLRDKTC